jgi:hypothetical protein
MDEPWPEGSENTFHRWLLEWPEQVRQGDRIPVILWDENKHWALPKFVEENPGRRPSCWWRWDAPRCAKGTYPGWHYDSKLTEPRKRLGGIGTPCHECLGYFPSFSYGVPNNWLPPELANLYRGTAKDVHGTPIFPEYFAKGFAGLVIDPDDPPVFESQASYLKRHGLLLDGELKRLKKADFKPEAVGDIT